MDVLIKSATVVTGGATGENHPNIPSLKPAAW